MKRFILFFRSEEWAVTGFFRYKSSVQDRVLEQDHNYITPEHEFLQQMWEDMWSKAVKLGCVFDNKIVLQITKIPNPRIKEEIAINATLYLGYYDNKISLGLSVYQDAWLKDQNNYFPLPV